MEKNTESAAKDIQKVEEKIASLFDLVSRMQSNQIESEQNFSRRLENICTEFSQRDNNLSHRLKDLEAQLGRLKTHMDNGWKEDLLNRLLLMFENQNATHGKLKTIHAEGIWRFLLTLAGAGSILYLILEKIIL